MSVSPQTAGAKVLPPLYLWNFMIVDPILIAVAGFLITTNLESHFRTLAPSSSSGVFFTPSESTTPTSVDSYLASPQLRVLLYQYISVWVAKAITDVLVLFHVRYRMKNAKDAELAVKALLLGSISLSVMFSAANVTVSGTKAVFPSWTDVGSLDWSEVNGITSLHLWAPVVMILIRVAWLGGVGRERIVDKAE